MLVLTRKQKEQIRIGDEVTVTILRINASTVRVGIDAPRHVKVVRAELTAFGQEAPGQDERPPANPPSAANSVKDTAAIQAVAETRSTARRELILSIRQHLAGAEC